MFLQCEIAKRETRLQNDVPRNVGVERCFRLTVSGLLTVEVARVAVFEK